MKGQIVASGVRCEVKDAKITLLYKRLVVPDANNLSFLLNNGELFIGVGSSGEFITLSDVEVPDELVEKALLFIKIREELNKKLIPFINNAEVSPETIESIVNRKQVRRI